jgi:broad specificity phosphatase PhoE
VVTSPYRRTLETAMIIAEALRIPVEVDPLVRERCAFSCDQGSRPAELARLWPELDFSRLAPVWWGELIESWPSLEARCREFRRRMRACADRDAVLIVSHWGFIRGLTGAELHNTEFIRLEHAGAALDEPEEHRR